MTSPSANDIEANDNANNANNANTANTANANDTTSYYNNTNSSLAPAATAAPPRIRVPPLLINEEPDLPTGFSPFELHTFYTFLNRLNINTSIFSDIPRNNENEN
jgi:hypothetical protein